MTAMTRDRGSGEVQTDADDSTTMRSMGGAVVTTDMEAVERRLAAVLERERRDAMVYTVLTVLATPVFVAMAALVVMAAAGFLLSRVPGVEIQDAVAFYTAANAFLAYMIVFVLFGGRRAADEFQFEAAWIAGVVLFLFLLAATYATPLPQVYPVGFALAYIVTGLLVLGVIGQVKLPDDITQMPEGENFFLALILVVSGFIVTAYGQVFGSSWLWVPPKGDEVRLGAWLLCRLAADPDRAMASDAVQGRIVGILVRLRLIGVTDAGAALTHKGLEFMRTTAGP
jgi:hypothetical protein